MTTADDDFFSDWKLAIHEAGHAAAAYALGVLLNHLALEQSGGVTRILGIGPIDERRRLWVTLAGPAADHAFLLGVTHWNRVDDVLEIDELCRQLQTSAIPLHLLPVTQDLRATGEWLDHVLNVHERACHLDANGFGDLCGLLLGKRASPFVARQVVAHFYRVTDRTLRRLARRAAIGWEQANQLQRLTAQAVEEMASMTTDNTEPTSPASSPAAPASAPSETATNNPTPRPDQGLYFTKNDPMKDVETR